MTRAEKRYGSLLDSVSQDVKDAINATFDLNSERLPSRSVIAPHLRDPYDNILSLKAITDVMRDEKTWMTPYAIRDLYLEHAFVVYTDEMLKAMKTFCDKHKMKIVHEVCCGTGWFSHWMKKYGIPLKEAVDNKTWKTYKLENKFLPFVKQDDAARFVKQSGDADMFVLSWPYMDPLAHMIWKNMKPGQYLMYIGEGYGGCTADEGFFNAVSQHQVRDDKEFNEIAKAFVQFNGLHDLPELYKKP